MPCQAALQDTEIDDSMRALEVWTSRMPGCCWGCGEPITSRHKKIEYPGDNVDFPGGMPPVFHLRRRACFATARTYEERWLDDGTGRQRMLTWPLCPGTLLVHGDGSSQCAPERGLAGCIGHLTHDHEMVSACFASLHRCPRGCRADKHPGTRHTPRPPRIPGAPF